MPSPESASAEQTPFFQNPKRKRKEKKSLKSAN